MEPRGMVEIGRVHVANAGGLVHHAAAMVAAAQGPCGDQTGDASSLSDSGLISMCQTSAAD
jgi:hypothetical protein